MLPFTNRFRGNMLTWKNGPVRPASCSEPAWLHGWGLRVAWHVESTSATHCR